MNGSELEVNNIHHTHCFQCELWRHVNVWYRERTCRAATRTVGKGELVLERFCGGYRPLHEASWSCQKMSRWNHICKVLFIIVMKVVNFM